MTVRCGRPQNHSMQGQTSVKNKLWRILAEVHKRLAKPYENTVHLDVLTEATPRTRGFGLEFMLVYFFLWVYEPWQAGRNYRKPAHILPYETKIGRLQVLSSL